MTVSEIISGLQGLYTRKNDKMIIYNSNCSTIMSQEEQELSHDIAEAMARDKDIIGEAIAYILQHH